MLRKINLSMNHNDSILKLIEDPESYVEEFHLANLINSDEYKYKLPLFEIECLCDYCVNCSIGQILNKHLIWNYAHLTCPQSYYIRPVQERISRTKKVADFFEAEYGISDDELIEYDTISNSSFVTYDCSILSKKNWKELCGVFQGTDRVVFLQRGEITFCTLGYDINPLVYINTRVYLKTMNPEIEVSNVS